MAEAVIHNLMIFPSFPKTQVLDNYLNHKGSYSKSSAGNVNVTN